MDACTGNCLSWERLLIAKTKDLPCINQLIRVSVLVSALSEMVELKQQLLPRRAQCLLVAVQESDFSVCKFRVSVLVGFKHVCERGVEFLVQVVDSFWRDGCACVCYRSTVDMISRMHADGVR